MFASQVNEFIIKQRHFDAIEAELKFWVIDDTFVDPAMGSPAQFPKMTAAVLMNLLELRAPGVGVN